jgi:hypothetical protein
MEEGELPGDPNSLPQAYPGGEVEGRLPLSEGIPPEEGLARTFL